MGFKEAKKRAIECLNETNYASEGRNDIDEKNHLFTGLVSAADLVAILKKCRGSEHSQSPHHQDSKIQVHVIVSSGWYIKFYFYPDLMFISVHPTS